MKESGVEPVMIGCHVEESKQNIHTNLTCEEKVRFKKISGFLLFSITKVRKLDLFSCMCDYVHIGYIFPIFTYLRIRYKIYLYIHTDNENRKKTRKISITCIGQNSSNFLTFLPVLRKKEDFMAI